MMFVNIWHVYNIKWYKYDFYRSFFRRHVTCSIRCIETWPMSTLTISLCRMMSWRNLPSWIWNFRKVSRIESTFTKALSTFIVDEITSLKSNKLTYTGAAWNEDSLGGITLFLPSTKMFVGVVHFRTTVTLTLTLTLRILMWCENGPVPMFVTCQTDFMDCMWQFYGLTFLIIFSLVFF